MFNTKISDQLPPLGVVVKLAYYRKIAGQELVDVGEKKLTVNLHAPVFDTSGCGLIFRVAQMGRKRGLH